MQPKFYADENVPLVVSRALQKRGIDLLTAQDVRMTGKSDFQQWRFTLKQQRTLITHDSDFLRIVSEEKIEHYGLLFFTQQMPIGKAIEEIERVSWLYAAEDLKNVVIFIPLPRY